MAWGRGVSVRSSEQTRQAGRSLGRSPDRSPGRRLWSCTRPDERQQQGDERAADDSNTQLEEGRVARTPCRRMPRLPIGIPIGIGVGGLGGEGTGTHDHPLYEQWDRLRRHRATTARVGLRTRIGERYGAPPQWPVKAGESNEGAWPWRVAVAARDLCHEADAWMQGWTWRRRAQRVYTTPRPTHTALTLHVLRARGSCAWHVRLAASTCTCTCACAHSQATPGQSRGG